MCNLECWRFSSFLLVIAIFNLHGFCHSEKAPNYTFVKEAISAAPISYYDYIIIGGGTSGCPLAATLSQKANVLVLERGGSPYENPNMTDVGNFLNTLLDNSPSSPSQWFISEDGVYNARARVLGGGSVLNAGFYSRATDDDVKRAGWNEALVKDSYKWVEKKVAFEPLVLQWQSAVRDGLLEAGVLPYNGFTYDHIYGTKVGGTIFDRDGHRHTAANLLEYADPKKITVYLHATVERILFTTNGRRPKADCVTFKDALGLMHKACLINNSEKNEIILSAGAIGSPQLLMLSGVGSANQLRSHDIEVVVDQPLVGQGMSDNPMNALLIPSPLPVEVSLAQVVGITRFGSYIESLSGLSFDSSWAKKLSEDYGLLPTQTAGRPSMVTLEATASAFDTVQSFLNGTLRAGIIGEKVMGPISSGHLELRSTNVDDNPSVTFNYFQEPEDLQKCVRGMRTIIDVVNSKSLSKFRYSNTPVEGLLNLMVSLPINLRPRHINSAISLEQFCNDTVLTIWHYHGGCQVGRVVDNDYRVLGVDALRVIDGSTFLNSPGTNPQATVMMLGRYMGLRILNER